MERMIHNRLYYLAETRGWLCPKQAGFRTSRSCEDQILRVTQTTSDGYQATKPKLTVLALLDFSKAFDRVWKEDILLRAVDKCLPLTFAKWLRDFLSNRQARVQINGEQGRPNTRGPERDSRSTLIVVDHVFSWPPVRLHHVRCGVGRRRSLVSSLSGRLAAWPNQRSLLCKYACKAEPVLPRRNCPFYATIFHAATKDRIADVRMLNEQD